MSQDGFNQPLFNFTDPFFCCMHSVVYIIEIFITDFKILFLKFLFKFLHVFTENTCLFIHDAKFLP